MIRDDFVMDVQPVDATGWFLLILQAGISIIICS